MEFSVYLAEQLERHSAMRPQDVVKMCYQAANGAEHLLSDRDRAMAYLLEEYNGVAASGGALYEPISDGVCRVDLAAWKGRGLPIEWLFRMFSASCRVLPDAKARFHGYLEAAAAVLSRGAAGFSLQEWQAYLREYQKGGMGAVHHSDSYREAEHPAYRIVDRRLMRVIPILERVAAIPTPARPLVIAIDGRAASGKTTLADALQTILDAEIIHMDDFFVPPALRTGARFATPGENIHHERFREEVLPFLAAKDGFAYRIFDCGRMDYHGYRVIGDKPFRVVEGSYSTHPIFGRYADITVFSDVSADEQRERIRVRNGEEMLARFLSRWIPMEEEYFGHYGIAERADVCL